MKSLHAKCYYLWEILFYNKATDIFSFFFLCILCQVNTEGSIYIYVLYSG